MLRSKFFDAKQVTAIAQDYHKAGLEAAEVAALDFAVKLTDHAYKITQKDIDGLRGHGYSDTDVFNIAAAAAGRNFMSKLMDAMGTEPEPEMAVDEELRDVLRFERPSGEGD